MQINLPNRVIRDIRTFAEDNAVKKLYFLVPEPGGIMEIEVMWI